MSHIVQTVVEYGSFALPPVSYGLALWSWHHAKESSLPSWRRAASALGVVLVGASLLLAVVSLNDFYRHPESRPGLPQGTILSMEAGAVVGVFAFAVSLFAKAWTRVSLAICSLSLLWVFFLIALSP